MRLGFKRYQPVAGCPTPLLRSRETASSSHRARDDVNPERIGGIGLSVGAEMLIEAAAESDALKAIVSEGGSGRSVRDDVANTDRAAEKVAAIMQAGVTVSTAVLTNNLPPASLTSLVPRIASRDNGAGVPRPADRATALSLARGER